MKILRVGDFAYQTYRSFVSGNIGLSYDDVAKKLTRNIALGVKVSENVNGDVWYAYGRLRILVKKGEKISCILNHRHVVEGWELNYSKKKKLDKTLNINV